MFEMLEFCCVRVVILFLVYRVFLLVFFMMIMLVMFDFFYLIRWGIILWIIEVLSELSFFGWLSMMVCRLYLFLKMILLGLLLGSFLIVVVLVDSCSYNIC